MKILSAIILVLVFCSAPIFWTQILASTFDQDEKKEKKSISKNESDWEEKKVVFIAPEKSMDDRMIEKINSNVGKQLPPREEIKKLDELIKTAIQNNLPNSLSLSYYYMGIAYKKLKQWQIALQFLELAERSKNAFVPNSIYFEMGSLLSKTGNFEASNDKLKRYLNLANSKEIKINWPINSTINLLSVEYIIAENYFALEKFPKAIEKYERIVVEEKKNQNELGLLECYSRLAACYISIGETKKGVAYYTASLKKINFNSKNRQKINETKEVVSEALRKQGAYQEELSLRKNILPFSEDGLEYLRLAQAYLKTNQITKAESSIDSYITKPSYNLIDKSEIDVIKQLSRSIKKRGDTDKAYRYLFLYASLEDTIKNRLHQLDLKNASIEGYQNILQLEILRKDKEISLNAINHLMKEDTLKEDSLKNQQIAIGLLLFLIITGIIGGIYILKVSRQRRIANQQLALRSLRSQMNPHFIFNALNSVNSFISENDERSANKFLSEFSRLMRSVMENSEYDFIPLSKELEILRIYLQLEHFRFKDKFEYTLELDENIDEESFMLPPMLVQPYIENAIWHGLRYKESKGNLRIGFKLANEKLIISIQDDGIGRSKSNELKTSNQKKNKSTALKNINERIVIFNELHKIQIKVTISDVELDGTGTLVSLTIPQNFNANA